MLVVFVRKMLLIGKGLENGAVMVLVFRAFFLCFLIVESYVCYWVKCSNSIFHCYRYNFLAKYVFTSSLSHGVEYQSYVRFYCCTQQMITHIFANTLLL